MLLRNAPSGSSTCHAKFAVSLAGTTADGRIATPLQDTYDVDQDTAQRYQAYYSPNIWPGDHLPQLESSFKQLGSLIIRVGLQLAGHCSK